MIRRVKPLLSFAFAVCFSLTLTNCGSNSSSSDSSVENTATRSCSETLDVAVHEHTLADNENLCASSDKVVVVDFENAGTEQSDGDSGFAGVDIIPYKIETAGTYTFRFEDENNNPHYAIMKDSAGNQVFRIEANGDAATVYLQAGSYNLFLYNKGSQTVPLFIQPDSASTSRSNGELLFSESDLNKLLSTKQCWNCDLNHANLAGANLTGANLIDANLTGATLTSANLTDAKMPGANLTKAYAANATLRGAMLIGANLTSADLSGADLSITSLNSANLTGANLTGANLFSANLFAAKLINADLSGADLRKTNLPGANLTSANLTGANLTGAYLGGGGFVAGAILNGANLTGATWTDGKKVCAPDSIGECK